MTEFQCRGDGTSLRYLFDNEHNGTPIDVGGLRRNQKGTIIIGPYATNYHEKITGRVDKSVENMIFPSRYRIFPSYVLYSFLET